MTAGGQKSTITIQAKLTFENKTDKQKVLDLMRRWSSCTRYACNRLIEGYERNQLKRELQSIFCLNSRYVDDAILKAKSVLSLRKAKGESPKKVIFGGRKLFEKLRKRHINGEKYKSLKVEWQERRKGNLYSRGDKTKKGNLNTRIVADESGVRLRINVGERSYVYANLNAGWKKRGGVYTDRNQILHVLSFSGQPYSVDLKMKRGNVYAYFSFEEAYPQVEITRAYGVIGIDINAYPKSIAWAETDEYGQLIEYGLVPLENVENGSQTKREYYRWLYAHEVIRIAREKGKAIVIEKLKIRNRGQKGDYSGRKSRRIRHSFGYRSLIEKIKLLAKRNGIEVIEVNPAYTSVIGMLRYAPQFMVSKDVASVYVIARRGLGLKEKVPANYVKLLERLDRKSLEELREYVRKRVKDGYLRSKHIKEIDRVIKSLESESGRVSRPLGGTSFDIRNLWQVLRVAVMTSLSPDRVLRDLSVLKPLLVSGQVGKTFEGRKFLFLGTGAMALSNTASWGLGELEEAGYKYPSQTVQNCTV